MTDYLWCCGRWAIPTPLLVITAAVAIWLMMWPLANWQARKRAKVAAVRLRMLGLPLYSGEMMAATPVWTWRHRLLHRLFPDERSQGLPGYDKPYMETVTHVRMGLADRLRCLATGHVRVRVRSYTDVPVGKVESWASADVRPWGEADR